MNLNQVTLPAVDIGHGVSTLSIELASEPAADHGPLVYFECEDLDQTGRQLRAMGIRFDGLPIDQPWLSRALGSWRNTLRLCWAGRNRR